MNLLVSTKQCFGVLLTDTEEECVKLMEKKVSLAVAEGYAYVMTEFGYDFYNNDNYEFSYIISEGVATDVVTT